MNFACIAAVFLLDFESESPRYKFSFCPYYLKRIDGKGIERHNIKGSDAEDQVFATYYQEPEELEHFIPTMRRLYTMDTSFVSFIWCHLMVGNVFQYVDQLCCKKMITILCRKHSLMTQ